MLRRAARSLPHRLSTDPSKAKSFAGLLGYDWQLLPSTLRRLELIYRCLGHSPNLVVVVLSRLKDTGVQ